VQPPCPPPDIDLEAWVDSLDRIRECNPSCLHLAHFGSYSDIETHLEALEQSLNAWAEWVRQELEQGKYEDDMATPFQQWAELQLQAANADDTLIARYNLANPPSMSVYGLARYWRKRQEQSA
jgi:hypothetical protein